MDYQGRLEINEDAADESNADSEIRNEAYTLFSEVEYTDMSIYNSFASPNVTTNNDSAMSTFTFVRCENDTKGNDSFDDDDYDETQPREEIFYADNISSENTTEIKNKTEIPTHFQLHATKALQSLEDEYRQTLENEPAPPKDISHSEQTQNIKFEGSQDEPPSPIDLLNNEEEEVPNMAKELQTGINLGAITNAMQKIKLQAGPSLDKKLSKWKPMHREYLPLTLEDEHCIIPRKNLLAFKRQTEKAKNASANLSRSATIAEAIKRLYLDDSYSSIDSSKKPSPSEFCRMDDDVFVIHCVGADLVECQTIETIVKALGPFVRWFHTFEYTSREKNIATFPRHLRIELLGPCVPSHSTKFGSIDLMPKSKNGTISKGRLLSATTQCKNCMYHDFLSELEAAKPSSSLHNEPKDCWDGFDFFQMTESTKYPNLVIAFNAGIWGYTDWHPTLKRLLRFDRPVPFVITSYTLAEAEEDEYSLEEILNTNFGEKNRCFWKPENNPFASRIVRDTKNNNNNTYYENGAWQSILMGSVNSS